MATKKTRNALVPVSDSFLAIGEVLTVTERSLTLGEGFTPEHASQVAGRFKRHAGISWLLGDFLIAAEGRFPDVYEQLEYETGLDYQTLANAKSLCKRFAAGLRLWDLTPSFYEAVQACDDKDAATYLDMAVSKGFARDDFRDYVREERREKQKQADKAAGINTGTNAPGAAGIGTGKVPPIKVEPSPKALATVALDNFTQAERGELASLILANTTGDTVEVKSYDLTVIDGFPVSMLLYAIERRVAKYDEHETAAALVKQIKVCGKLADKFEALDEPTNVVPPAGSGVTVPNGVNKRPADKDKADVTPAPKPAAKGKAGGKKADPAPADGDAGDLPVRSLDDAPEAFDYKAADSDTLKALSIAGDAEAHAEMESREQSDAALEAQYGMLPAEGEIGDPDGDGGVFFDGTTPVHRGGAEVFSDSDKAEMGITEDDGDVPGFPPGVNSEYAPDRAGEEGAGIPVVGGDIEDLVYA